MPEYNDWFPTSLHGTNTYNVKNFGAKGDGAAHSMSDQGYADLAAAQVDYPSATDMNDTADWCAITEAFKQAYTTDGVPHGTSSEFNKPILFPTGRYLTRKPLTLTANQSILYGTGYVQIYNENTTEPDNKCLIVTGLQNCRIENIDIQSAGGTNSIGLDLNVLPGGVVNTTGNMFINCNFASPGGQAVRIGNGGMGSETTFIKCTASVSAAGFVIDGYNALNYQFLACGGISNTLNWLRVNTGGNVVVQNASLADNGTDNEDLSAGDIWIGAGTAVILGSRTESTKFVISNGKTVVLACEQANAGNDMVFCRNGAQLLGCTTTQGRLAGDGNFTIDGCQFNLNRDYITLISAGTGGVIKITHADIDGYPARPREYFLDGDEVTVVGVASTGAGAAATNGTWIAHKLTHNTLELLGSTFVADTYNYANARIGPGPHYHLQNLNLAFPTPLLKRDFQETVVKDHDLQWIEGGTSFDNLGATADIQFTLQPLNATSWYEVRGTSYKFTVLAAHRITIRVYPGATPPSRIFRAGGYATAGANIWSDVVGSTLELYQVDGKGSSAEEGFIGHRWLVRAETGTWTIAGTP